MKIALPSLSVSTHGRYTRFVRRLRVALPVTAVAMLGLVLIWPHFDPAQAPKRHAAANAPEMHNSYFSGVDKNHQPYTVTADKTISQAGSSNDMDLVNPLAEVTLKNGAWVAIRADKGVYREDPGTITLVGNVRLYHDLGYEVTTSAAAVDLANGIAWSDKPTRGHGPRGEIEGQGFKLIQDSDKIVFTGNSRLLLKPQSDDDAQGPDEGTADNRLSIPQAKP